MSKILRGGVTGFARGRAGNYVYAVMPGTATTSGKREQIVRQAPDGVANPKTTGQSYQRMKVGPAQRFYNAFKELLSNAFQSVRYGNPSRRYFLSKAMKANGPYLPKGVDLFIPAEYLFSEGSLPSIEFVGRDSFISDEGDGHSALHITTAIEAGNVNPDGLVLAEKLGVSTNTQLTLVVVTNDNGKFTPHYAGLTERITLADIGNMQTAAPKTPALDAFTVDGKKYISFYTAGFNLPVKNVVAAAVVISNQDASGKWLRSTQYMKVNQILYDQIYGSDAQTTAINSYSAVGVANNIGSSWYYNLGLYAQSFNGRIFTNTVPAIYITGSDLIMRPFSPGAPLVGKYADGREVVFGSMSGTTASIICVPQIGSPYYTTKEIQQWDTNRNPGIEPWIPAYAVQAGLTPMPATDGDDDGDDDDNP